MDLPHRTVALFATLCLLSNVAFAQTDKTQSIAPADFHGVYAVDLPERIGQDASPVRWTLRCQAGACSLAMGKDTAENFDKLEPARTDHLAQARFALTYARERSEIAKREAPRLSPLLDSQSNLQSCIDLGYSKPSFPGAAEPGMILLCKLDRNPWQRPVVLLMGTILANCGPAFCRYEIIPMFKEP